jgi:glycosyltransferase involved in cell wall biosynthesis
VTIVVATYNLKRRGVNRVDFLLYSLSLQDDQDFSVIIVDGSGYPQAMPIKVISQNYQFCSYIHRPQMEFNKPALHNFGIACAESDMIMTTDADYLFRRDFVSTLKKTGGIDKFIVKRVMMLPKMLMTYAKVSAWHWGRKVPFAKTGDGGCQYASRDYFLKNPYDERFSGWGVMDNHQHWQANEKGLKCEWMEGSEILHQFHFQEKFKTVSSERQFYRNQELFKQIKDGSKSDLYNES